jgi:hypothetical protein
MPVAVESMDQSSFSADTAHSELALASYDLEEDLCRDGISSSVFKALPEEFDNMKLLAKLQINAQHTSVTVDDPSVDHYTD